MRILVTGITGAIGGGLAPRLVQAGHEVRSLSRGRGGVTPARFPAGVTPKLGDASSGAGLDAALEGVEVAYYLIHSMEPGSATGPGGATKPSSARQLEARERRAAENFAAAAVRAQVRRVVYLGGLLPPGEVRSSEHLSSRLAVERTLLAAVPDSVALRASIAIGARSRSFRLLVRLIERMPVLVLPAWQAHRTTPVDERDVLACLTACASAGSVGGHSLDLVGPETLSYGALIARIRDLMLLERPVVALPALTLMPIASRVAATIAGEQHELVGPLMEALGSDLLPNQELASAALGVRPHGLDAAIEHALREWEQTEPLRAR